MIKERLELYKAMYYYELDVKEKINSRVSIPLGVITLLLGGGFYFVKDIFDFADGGLKSIYIFLLSLYIIFIIASVISLICSYYGYEYHYLQKSSDIEKYIVDIKKYYEENYDVYFKKPGGPSKECLIEKDVKEFLIKSFIDTTQNNQELNFNKLKKQRYAILFIILTLFVGTINAPIYFKLKSKVNLKPVQVEVKQNKFEKEGAIKVENQGKKEPGKQLNPPQKPPPPPIQKLTESLDPSKAIRKR